jgi:hypothetical protein
MVLSFGRADEAAVHAGVYRRGALFGVGRCAAAADEVAFGAFDGHVGLSPPFFS